MIPPPPSPTSRKHAAPAFNLNGPCCMPKDPKLAYLSGSSVICQRRANSHFFRVFHFFVHTRLFLIAVCFVFFRQGWDPIWADITMLIVGNMFFQLLPIFILLLPIHAEKPCWGALYDPKTGLQKRWPLQWTESSVPCRCRQVAANRLSEAFWPSCQAHPDTPTLTLHPQSVLFSAPKVPVVHRAN